MTLAADHTALPSLAPLDLRRPGSTPRALSLEDAFWRNVGELSELWPWAGAGECWPWLGPQDQQGYGLLRWHGRLLRATRVSWSLAHRQPWPAGLVACHACDNPPCVRPDHVWPGTTHENALDKVRKRRHWLRSDAPRFAERLAEVLAAEAMTAAEVAAAAAVQAEWAAARAAWAMDHERIQWDDRDVATLLAQAKQDITEAQLTAETARQTAAHARRAQAAARHCSAADYGRAAVAAYSRPAPVMMPWAEMYQSTLPDLTACDSSAEICLG